MKRRRYHEIRAPIQNLYEGRQGVAKPALPSTGNLTKGFRTNQKFDTKHRQKVRHEILKVQSVKPYTQPPSPTPIHNQEVLLQPLVQNWWCRHCWFEKSVHYYPTTISKTPTS
mmetsp:Transcript_6412/g.9966  ORF Transcript_6412/g.9966 Transcript_6412/m.9966 type:complete len:113 (+) Transcript_6412:184-522(+)